jgi:hypothetical protein
MFLPGLPGSWSSYLCLLHGWDNRRQPPDLFLIFKFFQNHKVKRPDALTFVNSWVRLSRVPGGGRHLWGRVLVWPHVMQILTVLRDLQPPQWQVTAHLPPVAPMCPSRARPRTLQSTPSPPSALPDGRQRVALFCLFFNGTLNQYLTFW